HLEHAVRRMHLAGWFGASAQRRLLHCAVRAVVPAAAREHTGRGKPARDEAGHASWLVDAPHATTIGPTARQQRAPCPTPAGIGSPSLRRRRPALLTRSAPAAVAVARADSGWSRAGAREGVRRRRSEWCAGRCSCARRAAV